MATINGTPGNDDLDEYQDGGSAAANDTINGLGGDDTITVYADSRPIINGGQEPDFDTVNGGEGDDTLKFTISSPSFNLSFADDPSGGLQGAFSQGLTWTINFAGIENFDIAMLAAGGLTLGGGDDRVIETAGGVVNIDTGAGDDVVTSNGGSTTANLGAGSDRLVFDASGFSGNVALNGGALGGSFAIGYSGTYSANQLGTIAFSGVEHFTITGSNNDAIITGDGNDIVNAIRGDDYVQVGKGDDVVDGGEDIDRLSIDLSDETEGVSIDLTAAGEQQTGGTGSIRNVESFQNIVTGSDFNDAFIEGVFFYNGVFNTGDGDDLVKISRGNDEINMGDGNDRLFIDVAGASGNLVMTLNGSLATGYSGTYSANQMGTGSFTGVENLTVVGGRSDTIITGDGDDIISSGLELDAITVGKGNDVVDGGDDVDRLSIDLSDETEGVSIDLSKAGEQQTGGSGSVQNVESFFGTVTGSDFADTFVETTAFYDAVFNTGDGDDLVKVSRGNDTINMGDGSDRLFIDTAGASGNLVMTLSGSLAAGYSGSYSANQLGSGTFSGVESFTIVGGRADTIVTGDGDDVVMSGIEDDRITIGQGDDVVDGGEDIDRLSIDFSDEEDGVTVDLTKSGEQQTGGTGSIQNVESFFGTVTGSAQDDVFIEGAFLIDAVFNTGEGDDLVRVSRGNDTINMGSGNDRLVIDATGVGGNLVISGLAGSREAGYSGSYGANGLGSGSFNGVENFTVFGGLSDSIVTGDGDDVIDGLAGSDTVNAGGGDDTIVLGKGGGLTRATGGTGSDTFAIDADVVTGGATVDYVTDFQFGEGGDLLDLTDIFESAGVLDGYEAGDDAFAGGYLRFIAGDGDNDGAADDVLLQIDRDGGGDGFQNAVVLQNVALGAVDPGNVILPPAPEPENNAPVSQADSFTVDEDGTIAGNVLANDSDPDEDALTATLVDDVTSGTLDFNPDGSFTYTPDANVNGTVSFTYRASDGTATGPLTTVTIEINPVNDDPVAEDDGPFATEFETAIRFEAFELTGNDSDVDGDSLSILSVQDAVNGSVGLDAEGRPIFTPDDGYSGEASFTYTLSDGNGGTSIATVTLTVGEAPEPGNTAPVAVADAVMTDEDEAVSGNVLANDTDDEEDALTASLVSNVANGTLAFNPDGSFTYTPDANFNGTDSFTYRTSDGDLSSAPTNVTITVAPVNDAPEAANDSGYSTAFGEPLVFDPVALLANDDDVDGDTLSLLSVQNASGGSVALDDDGRPVFTPTAGYSGPASFTYTIGDGAGGTDTATVSLVVGSPPPPVGELPDCDVVQRDGTVNGSAESNDTLTGPAYHNSFYFDVAAQSGRDTITNFQKTDVLVTSGRLFDGNNDGIIMFGRNGRLNIDGPDGGDTVALNGVAGLRMLGEACEGVFVYADASVRKAGWIEGTLNNDFLSGDAGDKKAQTFFFDTALDLDLGSDRIGNFGARDKIVTTSALFDGNGDGIISFAGNRLLDLSGGTGGPSDPGAPGEAGQIALLGLSSASGQRITSLQFDGTTTDNGVTYYHYSLPGEASDPLLGF